MWLIYCAEGACLDVEKLAVSNRVVGMINSTRVDLIRVKDGGGRFSRVVLIIPSPLPSSFSNFSYSSIFLPLQKLIFFYMEVLLCSWITEVEDGLKKEINSNHNNNIKEKEKKERKRMKA